MFGCASDKYSAQRITYNAAQEIQSRTNVNDIIAVINASPSRDDLNMQIITWLESHLLNTGKFKIVSRQRIDTVMKELHFGITGYVSDTSAQSLGKLLGAKYILVFELKNVHNKSYLNIQVLETETAALVYSNSFRINNAVKNINTEKSKPLRF